MRNKNQKKWSRKIRFARFELPLLLAISMLPEVFMMGISYLWTVDSVEHDIAFLAEATSRRAHTILSVSKLNLKQLADLTSARCSPAAVELMRDKVFKVLYIRETGIINDGRLMCSNLGIYEPSVEITDAEHKRLPSHDGDIAIVPPVATLQGGKSILLNYRVSSKDYVNALIDPDIFHEFHDYVRMGEVSGVFLVREDGKALIGFGPMPASDLPPIAGGAVHLLHYQGKSFAIYKAGDFPLYTVVAASPAYVLKHWSQKIVNLLIIGLIVALALLLLLRRIKGRNHLLEGELWNAIESDEFCVHYQPIIDLENEYCIGGEALLRWQHPERGLLKPMVFLPIVEQIGMNRAITQWLIKRVEKELGSFLANNNNFHISINLSPSDIKADPQKSPLDEILFKQINPQQVIYEITEHSLIPDGAMASQEIIASLRTKGAKFALDDFGTGYSSLSYLHRFTVDYLKIDKAFVDGIASESSISGLIEHVIEIAASMGLETIAEGIEHPHQAAFLRQHGVRYGQGWHFGHPLPVDEFVAFISACNTEQKTIEA